MGRVLFETQRVYESGQFKRSGLGLGLGRGEGGKGMDTGWDPQANKEQSVTTLNTPGPIVLLLGAWCAPGEGGAVMSHGPSFRVREQGLGQGLRLGHDAKRMK